MKLLLTVLFLVATFASCTKEWENEILPTEQSAAYVSVGLQLPVKVSSDRGADDGYLIVSYIKTLYVIVFDLNNRVVSYDTEPAVQLVNVTPVIAPINYDMRSDVFRISSKAKKLLLIANPGPKLQQKLSRVTAGMYFSELNTVITNVGKEEFVKIEDETTDRRLKTLINTGEAVEHADDVTPIENLCMVNISKNIILVGPGPGHYPDAASAKAAAGSDQNRVRIQMRPVVSRVEVHMAYGTSPGNNILPAGQATFRFPRWALDAVNSSTYLWSKKIKLASVPGSSYINYNYYTIDPNFRDNAGIVYNTVNADKSPSVTFIEERYPDFCLENTVSASEQKIKNVTRIVVVGEYYPYRRKLWSDWLSFDGTVYTRLRELQTAYANTDNAKLKTACRKFYAAIRRYADDYSITINANSFETLTEDDLKKIPNGGEVVKEEGCIRWYQNGKNYYWCEIRHDDEITDPMAFAKYGVVRGYYYILLLVKVNGPGTPWYPQIYPEGDDGDFPDPEAPVDQRQGMIEAKVTIAPWYEYIHDKEI